MNQANDSKSSKESKYNEYRRKAAILDKIMAAMNSGEHVSVTTINTDSEMGLRFQKKMTGQFLVTVCPAWH